VEERRGPMMGRKRRHPGVCRSSSDDVPIGGGGEMAESVKRAQ